MKVREIQAKYRKIKVSKWTGAVENAFFSGEAFDRCRKLNQPEYEFSGRSTAQSYYIIGVDVGRKGCESVCTIVKSTPQQTGPDIKSLVNIITMSDEHFEDQAIKLKRLYYQYKAKALIIDANGLNTSPL